MAIDKQQISTAIEPRVDGTPSIINGSSSDDVYYQFDAPCTCASIVRIAVDPADMPRQWTHPQQFVLIGLVILAVLDIIAATQAASDPTAANDGNATTTTAPEASAASASGTTDLSETAGSSHDVGGPLTGVAVGVVVLVAYLVLLSRISLSRRGESAATPFDDIHKAKMDSAAVYVEHTVN